MHYYQFNVADYRKDTGHLSTEEHYAYRWLMDNYYLTEKPIPKETQLVIRRLGLGSDGLESVTNVLNDFFVLLDDGWHHKRIDAEIEHYHSNSKKNRINGKKGGRPKKQQLSDDKKPKKTQSVTDGNPNKSETNPNQEPITNNHKDQNTTSVATPPTCKHNEIIQIYRETLPELPNVVLGRYKGSTKEKDLRARWKEDKVHQDINFWRDFFKVVRTNPHWMGENDRSWTASFGWLIKRSNFDKVIEWGLK